MASSPGSAVKVTPTDPALPTHTQVVTHAIPAAASWLAPGVPPA